MEIGKIMVKTSFSSFGFFSTPFFFVSHFHRTDAVSLQLFWCCLSSQHKQHDLNLSRWKQKRLAMQFKVNGLCYFTISYNIDGNILIRYCVYICWAQAITLSLFMWNKYNNHHIVKHIIFSSLFFVVIFLFIRLCLLIDKYGLRALSLVATHVCWGYMDVLSVLYRLYLVNLYCSTALQIFRMKA